MKPLVALAVVLGAALLCQAVPITAFTDADTFVQRAQDIVIAKCLGPVPDAREYEDGLYPVDVQIVSVLKGAKKPSKTTIATIYPVEAGKTYLLTSLGGSAHGTDFLAVPELSVVEIPASFDLKTLKAKTAREQVVAIFVARLAETERKLQVKIPESQIRGSERPEGERAVVPPGAKGNAKGDRLADWPSDALIQVRPRLARAVLDQPAAEQRVRQYLGIDKAKELRLVPAYLTDNDFPFLRPQKLAVWLAEVRNLRLPAAQPKVGTGGEPMAGVMAHVYVAIDADSGQLIEAFTPPAKPWWREQLQVTGVAHEKAMRETGQSLVRPTDAPKVTLTDALQGMGGEQGQGQIVVRYALYSNRNAVRLEGNRSVPVAERRPALLVFREGLQMWTTGPGPGVEVRGRAMIVLDAQTGVQLYNESSGNPVR